MQKERYGLWIGMVNARKDLQVIEYLDWEIVKRAKSEGFKKLDLGACDAGPAQCKSTLIHYLNHFGLSTNGHVAQDLFCIQKVSGSIKLV
jgi:hypothetical protein